MKNLDEHSSDYFDKFSTAPVAIKPFDPIAKLIAASYIEKLQTLLGDSVEIRHRGSTAFEITGKGDIEFGVYPSSKDWERVLEKLECSCGQAQNIEENYVRFNDTVNEYEIEVIVLRGYPARVDMRLTEYLLSHRELLEEYERLKKQYAFSKRVYQQEKDRFFQSIISLIPDVGTVKDTVSTDDMSI